MSSLSCTRSEIGRLGLDPLVSTSRQGPDSSPISVPRSDVVAILIARGPQGGVVTDTSRTWRRSRPSSVTGPGLAVLVSGQRGGIRSARSALPYPGKGANVGQAGREPICLSFQPNFIWIAFVVSK